MNPTEPLQLFLCGDVMTGRGIDQALPHPGDPALHEAYVRDARDYLRMAGKAHGQFLRPVSFDYIWGDALEVLRRDDLDLRVINLETSITRSQDFWPGKAVHYRMHPANIECLTTARIDACTLANNHTLDWGYAGLAETLRSLDGAGIARAGAGGNEEEAKAPAILPTRGEGRVLLFAYGSPTSGIPPEWRATADRPGLNVLEALSRTTACREAIQMRAHKKPGDIAIASIHWGGNWGYPVPAEQVLFARGLIDEGFDLVHGHSSHHIKAFEVYRGHLILYGCGDFLTDYEGITGFEEFRGDLSLMYLPQIDPVHGRLRSLRLFPLQTRQFRLHQASQTDAEWIRTLLNGVGAPFGTRVGRAPSGVLRLE